MLQDSLSSILESNPSIGFRFHFLTLKDEARFGDISRRLYVLLCEAEKTGIIADLWIKPEELIDSVLKGLRRSERCYLRQNRPVLADIFSRRRIEFERRIELFDRSRPVDTIALKLILGDILFK